MHEGPGLDVPHLPEVLARVHAALAAHRAEIDQLNVFPVPDGDTGTNMVMTVRETVDVLASLPGDADPAETCRTVTRAAMRGARGNSGVILSQLLRALVETLAAADGPLDAGGFGAVLRRARDLAYDAVAEPVEGTILTAIAVAADVGRDAGGPGATVVDVSAAVCAAVHDAVARTREQLAALRDAGVVDAGARGFEVVLEALHAHLTGAPFDAAAPAPPHPRRGDGERPLRTADALAYRFEVQYLLEAPDERAADLRAALERLGDSVVVVSAGGLTTVHVHTNEVGAAIEEGSRLGRPHRIEVTYFASQMADDCTVPDPAAAGPVAADAPAAADLPVRRLGCVVVLPGAGLRSLAEQLHATVVDGGAGALPSVADLLNAVGEVRAERVVILPGHRNAVPTAHQAADVSVAEGGRPLEVVDAADTPPAVLAALAVCDPDAEPDEVLGDMAEAAAATRTGEVVPAVRDATTPAGEVRRGQQLAIAGGEVVAVHDDPLEALRAVTEALCRDADTEMVTLVHGADVAGEEATAAEATVRAVVGRADVQAIRGEQRPARYLLGVE